MPRDPNSVDEQHGNWSDDTRNAFVPNMFPGMKHRKQSLKGEVTSISIDANSPSSATINNATSDRSLLQSRAPLPQKNRHNALFIMLAVAIIALVYIASSATFMSSFSTNSHYMTWSTYSTIDTNGENVNGVDNLGNSRLRTDSLVARNAEWQQLNAARPEIDRESLYLLNMKSFPYKSLQGGLGSPDYGTSSLTGAFALGEEYRLWQEQGMIKAPSGTIFFPTADLSIYIQEEAMDLKMQKHFIPHLFLSSQEGLPQTDSFKSVLPSRDIDRFILDQKDHALLTRCGFKGGSLQSVNQDRSFFVRFFRGKDDTFLSGAVDRESALLMGIFDGHGERGHEVAHFAALELPRIFAQSWSQWFQRELSPQEFDSDSHQFEEHAKQTLKRAFIETDENEPVKGAAGCTSTVLFYPGKGNKVYLANAGDSSMLIVQFNKVTNTSIIVHQNRKDKPHLVDERKRIENMGGQVYIPPSLPFRLETTDGDGEDDYDDLKRPQESSRVLIPLRDGSQIALAMSRSIGDFDGKSVGLTSEPIVDVWDVQEFYSRQHPSEENINNFEWFAVIASDGIFDVIPTTEVVTLLGRSLYGSQNNGPLDSSEKALTPLEACEQLIRKASLLWLVNSRMLPYRDDITLGVSKIRFEN